MNIDELPLSYEFSAVKDLEYDVVHASARIKLSTESGREYTIGRASFRIINTRGDCDMFVNLDQDDFVSPFALLFDGNEYVPEVQEVIEMDYGSFIVLLALDIKKKYRGHHLPQKLIHAIDEAFNGKTYALLPELEYFTHCKKPTPQYLKAYYESIGFYQVTLHDTTFMVGSSHFQAFCNRWEDDKPVPLEK